jgi:RimJ/RimL family protein N-acetyltransferase
MELRDITMDDLALYESLLTDPDTMSELGGPLPREGLEKKLRRIVEEVETGKTWYLTIIQDAGTAAGSVCIWDHAWNGETINEIGWMVLPEFQGRGLATQAVRSILRRARSERRWDVIHAFPATTNVPSNAICRGAGFSMLGETDIEYAGRILHCNHWRVDIRSASPA